MDAQLPYVVFHFPSEGRTHNEQREVTLEIAVYDCEHGNYNVANQIEQMADNINFELKSNGQTVQVGNTNLMLWKIDELVAYVSQYFTLKKGDIIFTGTPKGVAKVVEGDVLEGFIEDKSMFKIQIK